MARNGRGAGTVYQRCNKCRVEMIKGKCPKCGGRSGLWRGQASLGVDKNGKRRRPVVYGKTEAEAWAKLHQLQADSMNANLPSERMTFGQYLQRWLKGCEVSVKPTTLEAYRRHVDKHLAADLGHILLHRLTAGDFQMLYAAKLSAGLKARTVDGIHRTARAALNAAVATRMIPRSPLAGVKGPRVPKAQYSIYTPEQLLQLGEALRDDYLGPLYYLVVATGCRRGEACGLRWEDVDLETGWVTIRQAAALVNKTVVMLEPKTDDSTRPVKLPPEAVAWLWQHQQDQRQHIQRAGADYKDQGLVFARPDGSPLVPGHVSQHFRLVLHKAGLPPIRLHDLRHTHASLLLAAGADEKAVGERLGHRSPLTTRTIYQHIPRTLHEQLANTMQAILTPASAPKSEQKATHRQH